VYYEAVNEVNDELNLTGNNRLQIGNPALFYLDMSWLQPFLEGYKNDPSPNKRIDFINYHGYLEAGSGGGIFYKDNPSVVYGHRAKVEAELRKAGLDVNTPSFITETGIYPGPMGEGAAVEDDVLRQAAGVASLHYWFIQDSPRNRPFHWAVRHPTNGRKDQLVTTRDSYGVADFANGSTNKFTPYGNMVLMQKMMKAEKVKVRGLAIINGKGVYAVASKSAGGASIMLWNYQSGGTETINTAINMTGLKGIFSGGFKIRRYSIDSENSNYTHAPDDSDLKMVVEETVAAENVTNGTYSTSLSLEPNSIHLLLLEL
jgi:hypothetical protein